MRYDFVEIGCADFDTLIQKSHDWMDGISVEPVSYYLERLPKKPNGRLVNAAIGLSPGRANMYFQRREVIEAKSLPGWLCGCNHLNAPHPTVTKVLAHRGIAIDTVVEKEEVRVMTLRELCDENSISHIGFLKLDIEGMDVSVVANNVDLISMLDVDKLEFEHNELTVAAEYEQLRIKLESAGYVRRQKYSHGALFARDY